MEHHNKLAILVGGGPAPGINSVVAAATIRAKLQGIDVIGVRDGFEWLMQDDINHVIPLSIEAVSRIHFRGGSYLGIARANPTKDPQLLENTVNALLRLNVSQLITIGGDDTAFSAMQLEQHARRPDSRRPCAEDDRQRPRSAAAHRYVRVPVGTALRRRHREEPDGRCEDDLALVLRDRHGPQSGASCARDRQGRWRDDHAYWRRVRSRPSG